MKKTLTAIILGTSLALGSCTQQPPYPSPTEQTPEISVQEIPAGDYYIIELSENSCFIPKKENEFRIDEGRILIEEINHKELFPKDFRFEVEKLPTATEDEKHFVKGTYGLEPGEYQLWVINRGFKAPFKKIKSKHYIQITPRDLPKDFGTSPTDYTPPQTEIDPPYLRNPNQNN